MGCTLCLLCQRRQKEFLILPVPEDLVLRIRIGISHLFYQNTCHRTNVKVVQLVNRLPCYQSFGKQLMFFTECLKDSVIKENGPV